MSVQLVPISTASRLSPFPGISPFRVRTGVRCFFERAQAVPRASCSSSRFTAPCSLMPTPGVGKSSLINAGLLPRAIEEEYEPYTVKVQPRPGEEISDPGNS